MDQRDEEKEDQHDTFIPGDPCYTREEATGDPVVSAVEEKEGEIR